jgi:hypothetical protein
MQHFYYFIPNDGTIQYFLSVKLSTLLQSHRSFLVQYWISISFFWNVFWFTFWGWTILNSFLEMVESYWFVLPRSCISLHPQWLDRILFQTRIVALPKLPFYLCYSGIRAKVLIMANTYWAFTVCLTYQTLLWTL